MSLAVAWVGPVSAAQVKGTEIAGVPAVFENCKGDGDPACLVHTDAASCWPECGAMGQRIGGTAGGSIVRGLLAAAGVPNGELIIGSFSAGHEIAKPALMEPADRALVRAVMLADSTYTAWANQAAGTAAPPEGYVRYALDAATSPDKLFVATASSVGIKYPSSVAGMLVLMSEVERRSGMKFSQVSGLPGVTPAPLRAWRLGNVWLCDYGTSVPHGDHAMKLAPQAWRNVLMPFLGGAPAAPPDDVGIGPLAKLVLFGIGTGLGYAGLRAARKYLERRT